LKIPIDMLLEDVREAGGEVMLQLDGRGASLKLRLPDEAAWLREEIRARKLEVVAELRRR
jgi:hypothetical protein